MPARGSVSTGRVARVGALVTANREGRGQAESRRLIIRNRLYDQPGKVCN